MPKRNGRTYTQDLMRHEKYGSGAAGDGVSIFDPVLAELCLRWFAPPGGIVWNPFMGESSIGIVASRLGYRYTAVDVRPEQVAANQAQSDIICRDCPPPRWLVGNSATIDPEDVCRGQPDFILSCPPYADLERYSDDPADLSTMAYPAFRDAYRAIIARAGAALKENRFACFVVGEVRGPDGNYYGFVPDTVTAFRDAGLAFYNEAVLVTACGSLPTRTRRQFEATRKLGRTHQSVLIFVKGDARYATMAVGKVDFGEPDPAESGSELPLREQPSTAVRTDTGLSTVAHTRWRVSAAWATKLHDCTAAGSASRCGGRCCRHQAFWPPKSGDGGCPRLGPTGCTFDPADKPVTCALYPLVLSPKGTLIMHHKAMLQGSPCKDAYRHGPMIIDAIRPGLESLFGADQVSRVRADVVDGRDGFFDVPPAVAAAYARERELEAGNMPPAPRRVPGAS